MLLWAKTISSLTVGDRATKEKLVLFLSFCYQILTSCESDSTLWKDVTFKGVNTKIPKGLLKVQHYNNIKSFKQK